MLTLRDQERFSLAPQSLYEMYVVCTRPTNVNGFGYTSQQACAELVAAGSLFEILPESAKVYPTWEQLVAKYAIMGKRAHDVRLVALMLQHNVSSLLTFNDADFRPFTEIQPINPFDLLSIPRV